MARINPDPPSRAPQIINTESFREELLKVKPELELKQVTQLKKLKQTRNNLAVKNALKNLKKGAQGKDNLMPLILNAIECYTTLGEISYTLREVFGEYRENVVL